VSERPDAHSEKQGDFSTAADMPAVDKKVSQDRRPPLDFYARLHKQPIRVKTIPGQVIEGILKAYSPYDLLIEIANGEEIILPKHAILFTCRQAKQEGAV
jgi:sRNA-binding regulator protein Hfq